MLKISADIVLSIASLVNWCFLFSEMAQHLEAGPLCSMIAFYDTKLQQGVQNRLV